MTNGRASRNKGNRAELDVCRILTRWAGRDAEADADELPFRRRFTSATPLSGSWKGAGDLLAVPALDFPYCVEVKCIEGWTLDSIVHARNGEFRSWWAQCKEQAERAKAVPMLFIGKNLHPWMVAVPSSIVAGYDQGMGVTVLHLLPDVSLFPLPKAGAGVPDTVGDLLWPQR